MPKKLTDRQKKEKGTYRPGRETAPLTPAEAQAAVVAATVALEAAKRQAKKRNLTARQSKLAQDKVRVCGDNLELALEASAKALKAADDARKAVSGLRPGLLKMTREELMNAQPPITKDEELELLAVECGLPPTVRAKKALKQAKRAARRLRRGW